MDDKEIEAKIGRIFDGLPCKIGNMTIKSTNSGKLLVTGWTSTTYIENISKENVLRELKELKLSYSALAESFSQLQHLVKANNMKIEFLMEYDTGKAGIGLCSEIDGELNWYYS